MTGSDAVITVSTSDPCASESFSTTSFTSSGTQYVSQSVVNQDVFITPSATSTTCGDVYYAIMLNSETSPKFVWYAQGNTYEETTGMVYMTYQSSSSFAFFLDPSTYSVYSAGSTATYNVFAYYQAYESSAMKVASYDTYNCDCSLLTWSGPTSPTEVTAQQDRTTTVSPATPSFSDSARSSNSDFGNCFDQSKCPTTGSYAS